MFGRRWYGTLVAIMFGALSPLCLLMSAQAQLPPAMFGPGRMPVRPAAPSAPKFTGDGSGALQVRSKDGKNLVCPLKHTDVHASISGYVARVTVKQLFANPFREKIEALYTFPLSDTGAVDEMTMRVGSRTIHGTIKKREEAKEIYETAKSQGHVAALLDQERTNIFTQSVANIEPGKEVEVTLTYVDLLPYQNGSYQFAFPTVVGPRFNPGAPVGKTGVGFAPDTTEVPDASKITPHVAPEGVRAGHDISINVAIDAGIPIGEINSQLHQIKLNRNGANKVVVELAGGETIPNKDFVLNWSVAEDKLKSGYLTNAHNGSGYFTLMILPPKKATSEQIQPKEMVFLIDTSGSQSGKPLEKAKEAMDYSLDHMNSNDTFQVMAFNSGVTQLFEHPRRANPEMIKTAKSFVRSLQAQGGTWMQPAVEAVCAQPADEHRLRIVSFMTDGFVGNDMQIVGLVKKLREKSRWFPFGTGNSVNRFLIDNIAKFGGGEADYVYLNSDAAEVGKKFYDKIASPVLTDIKVDFDGAEVKEVMPGEMSDVWAQRPLYISGRYTKPGSGKVTISGFSGGKPYKQTLTIDLPAENSNNAVLGSIWARAKVDRLMGEDYLGAQTGNLNKELKDEIVKVALEHHIMTQYTSFVAVEEKTVTKDGKPTTVEVPVELPDGVSREGVFGEGDKTPGGISRPMAGYGGGAGGALAGRGAMTSSAAGMASPQSMNAYKVQGGLYTRSKSAQVRSAGDALRANAQLAAAPPPMAVPSPVSTGYYNGPAQLQHQGLKNELRKADAAGDEEKVQKKPLDTKNVSKLSADLQKLLKATIKPGDTKFGNIKLTNGTVRVKVMVKNADAGQVQQLTYTRGLQVETFVFSNKAVIGSISIAQLADLAGDDNVVSITVAD